MLSFFKRYTRASPLATLLAHKHCRNASKQIFYVSHGHRFSSSLSLLSFITSILSINRKCTRKTYIDLMTENDYTSNGDCYFHRIVYFCLFKSFVFRPNKKNHFSSSTYERGHTKYAHQKIKPFNSLKMN